MPVRGRPRHFDPGDEIQMLLDAASVVIRRNDYRRATLQEILDQSGLSTRAFYRHFESKTHLLRAVQHRDAQKAAARMAERMRHALGPWNAVELWVNEMTGIVFDPLRARRIALLAEEVTQRTGSRDPDRDTLAAILTGPLLTALQDGLSTRALPLVDLEHDPFVIFDLCADVLQRCLRGGFVADRGEAEQLILRFCRSALAPQ
jgi:AcrR family transcriptional regulator